MIELASGLDSVAEANLDRVAYLEAQSKEWLGFRARLSQGRKLALSRPSSAFGGKEFNAFDVAASLAG